MTDLIIVTILECNIILTGFSTELTKIDKSVIKRAYSVCKAEYDSCPASIDKPEKLRYNVQCKTKGSK